MEKFPPPENNKNLELKGFLKLYPLPEEHKNKAELALELKKIISSLIKKSSRKNDFEHYNKLANFALNLEKRYKNARQYYLFHVLIGSSITKTSKFDFEGDDSIEKFLRSQSI